MRVAILLSLVVSCVFSSPLFASAGATSSGVTTSVGNPNDPSAQVQAQSSGFVQQNQQLQNGQTPNGTAGNTAVAVLPNAANGGNNAGGAGNNAGSAQHTESAAATAVPAPPPPPPPVYESTIRKLDRPNATVTTSVPPAAVQKPEPSSTPAKAEPKPAPVPPPVVAKAPAKPASPDESAVHPNAPAAEAQAERPAPPPAITGGRGEAPDGFTFYSGSAIAGMLLAFAFATYLKMGRNESAK